MTAVGALTPLGDDPVQSAAAIRAGLSALGEHPYFDVVTPDPEWDEAERLTAALVPGIPPLLGCPARLLELALGALRNLSASARLLRSELRTTALLLALPSADDVVRAWGLAELFAAELCRRAGLPPFPIVRVVEGGHGGVLRQLGEAARLCESGEAARCIVLGVDSYDDEARLGWLDARYRLRSDRAKDGFLPGEAAVALLVEPAATPARPALLTYLAPSFAAEAHTVHGELASSGAALAEVVRAQLAAPGAPPVVPWVLCDLNGESYRAAEWALVSARLADRFAEGLELEHPADCVGDVGAASAGLYVVCAAQAFRRGYAPADSALLFTASDDGERAALFVHAPAGEPER
ncbi:MAG: hypothetical protein IT373_24855, partial [Polyangiaceae bacterium]|nr:hypothetical protein [Polyangiaceae bacterium]